MRKDQTRHLHQFNAFPPVGVAESDRDRLFTAETESSGLTDSTAYESSFPQFKIPDKDSWSFKSRSKVTKGTLWVPADKCYYTPYNLKRGIIAYGTLNIRKIHLRWRTRFDFFFFFFKNQKIKKQSNSNKSSWHFLKESFACRIHAP